MAIVRPKPKTFSAEQFARVEQASSMQTGKSVAMKSLDPQNFPVFDIPVNKKVLVYVPNHRVATPDGRETIRMDKGAFHPIIDKGSYHTLRCISGIVTDDYQDADGNTVKGYDGTCPCCDNSVVSELWDLYRYEYAEIAKQKGIDPDNDPDDTLKPFRQELARKMAIKQAEVMYTFPIVVVDCEEGTTTPKKNAEGQLTGKPMWYTIRETTYMEKWAKSFEAMEDGQDHPAGCWFILNFEYNAKSGKHDKMGSARALAVTYRQMANYGEWAKYFDNLTAGWTPQKATETVIANIYPSLDEARQVVDTVMQPVRNKLSMFELQKHGLAQGGVASAPQQALADNAEQTLAGFGGVVPNDAPPQALTGEAPQMGVE